MTISAQTPLITGTDEEEALEEALAATAREAEAAALVEHRVAVLGALVARHGSRYLPLASREVEDAMTQLLAAGRTRQALTESLASLLGCGPLPTLGELAAVAPDPYGSRFAALRAQMLRLKGRIERLTTESADLLGRRIAYVTEALQSITAEPEPTYGRPLPGRSRFLRGVL